MWKRRTLLTAAVLLSLAGGVAFLIVDRYRAASPAARLERGLTAARAGNLLEATRLADLLLEDGKGDPSHLLRAEVRFQQQQYAAALAELQQVRAPGELRHPVTELAGRCLMALGERWEAERLFLGLVAEQPGHADAHRFLAVIYYDQGDSPRALPHLHEVARLAPGDARPHRLIGLIHKDQDQTKEAVAAYREALRRDPNGPAAVEVRVELAECLLTRHLPDEALDALGGLDRPDAVALRGEALKALNRSAEAAGLLEAGLGRDPAHAGLLRVRAELHLAAGQPADAARLLEAAAAVDPSERRIRYQLALAYERLGRTDDASKQQQLLKDIEQRLREVQVLSRAASDDPWDAAVRAKLADLYEQLRRPQMAKLLRQAAEACRAKAGP